MTRRLYDASTPPPDPHLDVCGFYIGGDTPHIWTDQEIAGQSARWRLPIYTCDNPAQRNPAADGASAVAWLRAHSVPAGCALALDYETAIDGAYVTAFDGVVRSAGWTVLLYGSLSSVTQNPRPSAGYWTASWTGQPHLDAGAAATQYASDTQLGTGYDLSLVADGLVLWDTHPAAPAPAPTPDQEDIMQILRVQGSASVYGAQGGVLWGIAGPAGLQPYLDAGVQQITVPQAEIDQRLAVQPPTADKIAAALAALLPSGSGASAAQIAAALAPEIPTAAQIAHAQAVEEHSDTPAS